MHILLTDVLTCPRCGPRFGLIVLADRMEGRRVAEGSLGCANCREQFPVRAGVAELGSGPEREAGAGPLADDPERAYRVAALLGVGDASAMVLLVGASAGLAARVSSLLRNAEVVAVGEGREAGPGEVSWVRIGDGLPFRDRSLGGVALLAGAGERLWDEAARVLRPGAHLVVDPAGPDGAERAENTGLRPLLEQDGVMVAAAPAPR